MIKGHSPDGFNRGLIFILYHTYTNYPDEKEGKEKRNELRNSIASFPGFIQASIKKMEETETRK